MALRFFRIPIEGNAALEAEVNALLAKRKVMRVSRELVQRESEPAWAVCVEYIEEGALAAAGGTTPNTRKSKIDYREVLNEADFALYSKLREKRKELAEKESIPVYAVFTNEQMSEIAKQRPQSKTALSRVVGLGEGKLSKYAEAVLELIPRGMEEDEGSVETV